MWWDHRAGLKRVGGTLYAPVLNMFSLQARGPWPFLRPCPAGWIVGGPASLSVWERAGQAVGATEPSRREWVLGQLPTAWPPGSTEGRAHSKLSFVHSVG